MDTNPLCLKNTVPLQGVPITALSVCVFLELQTLVWLINRPLRSSCHMPMLDAGRQRCFWEGYILALKTWGPTWTLPMWVPGLAFSRAVWALGIPQLSLSPEARPAKWGLRDKGHSCAQTLQALGTQPGVAPQQCGLTGSSLFASECSHPF